MIGFRLKFDNIPEYSLENFLLNYISEFDFFEIKLTNTLLKEGKLRYVLELSEKYATNKFSIHLPKNFLDVRFDYNSRKKIIQYLNGLKCENKTSLIVHFPLYYDEEFVKCLLKSSNELEEKYYILLENENVDMFNVEYLKMMDSFMQYLIELKKINNIGICFDIGHFEYGIMKEGLEKEKMHAFLLSLQHFSVNIKEYHIHDYIEKRDHLQLKKGVMNLESVSNFLRKINCDIPIIIETNIVNPDLDGREQVKIIKEEILMRRCNHGNKTDLQYK